MRQLLGMRSSTGARGLAAFLLLACLTLGAAAGERGVLWRIDGTAGTSHLLGTLHSADPRVTAIVAELRPRLDGARLLVLELVPDAAAMTALQKALHLPAGEEDLAVRLGATLYAEVVAALLEEGLAEPAVRRLAPWAAYIALSLPAQATGETLDQRLYRHALSNDQPVAGLESIDEQIEALSGLEPGAMRELLRDALEQRPGLAGDYEATVRAWLDGDLDGLLRMADAGADGPGRRLDERLRSARNERMLERLLPRLESGGLFIAVGALHLPGADGLLAGLRERGYRVSPLR